MEIRKEVEAIKERNKKVEADKARETSNTRKIIISAATYIAILVFLLSINAPNPYFNALIPAAAFVISTFSLPFLKKMWVEKIYRK